MGKERKCRVVVIGLGYVGLPLAAASIRAGHRVSGLDADETKVRQLLDGVSYVDDLEDAAIKEMLAAGFVPSSDPACLDRADVAVICVPTPLRTDRSPDLDAVEAAAQTVVAWLRPGMLVLLESTTYPGTTDELVRPILERSGLQAGVDFALAYSPERIDPGNPAWGIRNTPKVVGGLTDACREQATAFYRTFVDTVVPVSGTREAEMAKLLENTYRHVNIALVNEMAVFCAELGIDLWESIQAAATKPFGFEAFFPGPGVGGHCIPIDPSYLSYKVRTLGYPFRFVELAQEINARMPAYVVHRVIRLLNGEGRAVNGARLLLMGITYKPDVADERESPARPLARELLRLGGDIRYHDPYVPSWDIDDRTFTSADDLTAEIRDADLVLVLQHHSTYRLEELLRPARLVFDTRGSLSGVNVHRL